jgi:Integrase core domain
MSLPGKDGSTSRWSSRVEPPDHRLVDARLARGGAGDRRAGDGYQPSLASAGRDPSSDRGSQYGAAVYGLTLRESGLAQSMGRRGSALDNAERVRLRQLERENRILREDAEKEHHRVVRLCRVLLISRTTFRTELVHRRSFHTRDQAREHVFRWIEGWYNPRRRHSSLDYLSPADYESTHRIGGDRATTNGRTAPVDPDQPALPEGALTGIGNPTRPNENVSTRPR